MSDGPDYDSMFDRNSSYDFDEDIDPSDRFHNSFNDYIEESDHYNCMSEIYDNDDDISENINSSINKNSDGCFIATAAYGSDMDIHVITLRQFRDSCLINNFAGMVFVNIYYKISPPIANIIKHNSKLRCIVRCMLWPLISLINKFA